jgi:hypothetical protein
LKMVNANGKLIQMKPEMIPLLRWVDRITQTRAAADRVVALFPAYSTVIVIRLFLVWFYPVFQLSAIREQSPISILGRQKRPVVGSTYYRP